MASHLRQTSLAGGSLGTDHFSQNVFFLWMDFFRQVSLALIFLGIITPSRALLFSNGLSLGSFRRRKENLVRSGCYKKKIFRRQT